MRVRRVDFRRRRLTIAESVTEVADKLEFGTPKTHQHRSVPLPAGLAGPLAARCEGKQGGDLVLTTAAGTALRLRNWRRVVFDQAVRAAGLSEVTPHDLRHTAASLAVASGATVKSVQRMLGHASAAMTLDVYSGLFDDDLTDLAARMDAAAQAAADSHVGVLWARPRPPHRVAAIAQVSAVGPVGIEPTTRGLKVPRVGVRGGALLSEHAGEGRGSASADGPGRPWTGASGTQSGTHGRRRRRYPPRDLAVEGPCR